jgi:beta-galactosidase
VRMWTWEAFAAGAELVSYFRWRQAPFAQEQMHEALLLPDSTLNEAWYAARDIAAEIEKYSIALQTTKADVALVFDYESAWAHQIQPQAASFTYLGLMMDVYRALRANGLSVDIVQPKAGSAVGHKMVIAPGLFHAPEDFMASLDPAKQLIVLGPRTGAKTADFAIPASLPPGAAIQKWLDFKVRRIDSLPEHSPVALAFGGQEGRHVKCWREFIIAGDTIKVHANTADGEAFHISDQAARVHYITGWADADTYRDLYGALARQAGLATLTLHRDIRLRDQGDTRFVFNHGPDAVDISELVAGYKLHIGQTHLEPCGVILARRS